MFIYICIVSLLFLRRQGASSLATSSIVSALQFVTRSRSINKNFFSFSSYSFHEAKRFIMKAPTLTDCRQNGKKNGFVNTGDTKRAKFWQSFQFNEWTFSLLLFVISLGIVAGKLYVNYGARCSMKLGKNVHSSPAITGAYDFFSVRGSKKLSEFDNESPKTASQKLMNVSREYGDTMAGAVVGITYKYCWLLRAATCGIAMMAFTWFIIYKDSSIPGVNPPSPFSPTKRRYPEKSRLQINYLVGVLNGALIFVYMCL